MNTNVKELKIGSTSYQKMSPEFIIQEIAHSLNEARKYAEMHTDPELVYFISMAQQCANERILFLRYKSK